MPRFGAALIHINCQRNAENFSGILYLVNDYQGHFFCIVITIIDIEDRMSASIIPLVPVPVEVLARYLFKNQPQVLRLCVFKFKIDQVEIQGLKKSAVA